MNIDIDSYKSKFLGGNARQYLFFVYVNFPAELGLSPDAVGYYVKSTELPAFDFEHTNTNFIGQEYKQAGEMKFEDWTVTFNIDHKADIIKHFWDWAKLIHNPETNDYGDPSKYMVNQEIHLLGMETGTPICTYKLYHAWPVQIGTIALDYGTNEFASVEITFTFQYYTIKQLTAEEQILTPLTQEQKQAMFVPAR